MRISPTNAEVAIVSFEGPDRYSTVGGLATRVTDLAPALVARGYTVTHVFIGDPDLPARETRLDGRLRLVRWCQWISRYHPRDVYDGEWGKWRDFGRSVPPHLLDTVVAPARDAGRRAVLLFEDWQTAEAATATAEGAYARGLARACVPLWNANNTYGCGGIDFGRLRLTTQVTTVSRWMRSELRRYDMGDAMVVPNGIAERMLAPVVTDDVAAIDRAKGTGLLFVKVGRFDRDKRWLNAVDAITVLKERGHRVRFLFRGGASPHRDEVLAHLGRRGVAWTALRLDEATPQALGRALAEMREEALFLDFFVPERVLRALYAAADGVLANSEREPFGLVGLEVMGAGGVAYVGVTGEDYAQPLTNCVVVRTDDPREIAEAAAHLRARPEIVRRIRGEGRQTARRFAWPQVIEDMELVWEVAAERAYGALGL